MIVASGAALRHAERVSISVEADDASRKPVSFEAFVSEHAGRLLRLAYLITDNHHDAEELLQEALINVHRHWRRVRRAEDVVSYCRRILVNQHLSNKRRKRIATTPVDEFEAMPAAGVLQDEIVERERLRTALLSLPVRQRTVVVLRYYENLDTSVIAELLGISQSTVRSNLARGLAALRESWSAPELEKDSATHGRTTDPRPSEAC
jgi:RNA polymerase sigma-70 factor (sigma-E family)